MRYEEFNLWVKDKAKLIIDKADNTMYHQLTFSKYHLSHGDDERTLCGRDINKYYNASHTYQYQPHRNPSHICKTCHRTLALEVAKHELKFLYGQSKYWSWKFIEPQTYEIANKLIESLPKDLPMPSLGADEYKGVTFDWYAEKGRSLTVSLNFDGIMQYTAIIGPVVKHSGIVVTTGEWSETIIELIKRIFWL